MSSYGEAKKRDMMRSILPSTRRKGARDDLAHIRRNNRHHINQHLAEFRGPSSGAIEHYEYGDYDLNHYPDGEIKWAVWERRAADKVAPIIRWAQQITKDLPQKERMDYMRSILPDTTIGRHALQHIESAPGMEDPDDHRYYWRRSLSERLYGEEKWVRDAMAAEFAQRLQNVIERGLVKRFNESGAAHASQRQVVKENFEDRTWLERTYGERSYWDPKRKERYIWVYVRRPLLGMHDIDDFLKEFVPFEMIEHPVSGRIIRSPSRVWGIRRKFEVLDEILKELGV
jgi:hypothetical protein